MVGIAVLAIFVAGAYGLNASSSDTQSDNNSDQGEQIEKEDNKKISEEEAKSIAQKHVDDSNSTVGSVKTVNIGGKETNVVSIVSNGKNVGEIEVDPETGKVVGGAGGAPE
ncbi:MAG: PepSY domain-containing protein [Methanobacterium sp.]